MKPRPYRPKPPPFNTVADVQRGEHYASHVDQPEGPRHMLLQVDDEAMDRYMAQAETARGIPSAVNYKDGVIRVWPWPAEGWQVWAVVSGKDVTPA